MKFSLSRRKTVSLLALSSILVLAGCATASESGRKPAPQTKTKKAVKPVQGEAFTDVIQRSDIDAFIDDMVARNGFDRAELQATLEQTQYVDRAVQLMMPAPPGKPKNWTAYRSRFVEPVRIDAGVAFWNTYADALSHAETQYGVPAEIIVAILGVETIYGRNTGNFRVMDAIATLAFAYPDTPNRTARMTYFRRELENTLLFARDERIDPFSLLGSYAGAIGWPQFMPGSIRKYAVDFDGNGHIDLRNSPVDAIGSVAHFLVEHGWRHGEPLAFPVVVDPTRNEWQRFLNQGLAAKFSLEELKSAGVIPTSEPPADMPYGLVDLQNGDGPTDYWLGANNFFAITQYNRSFFYAMSVIDLSRAIRSARAQ